MVRPSHTSFGFVISFTNIPQRLYILQLSVIILLLVILNTSFIPSLLGVKILGTVIVGDVSQTVMVTVSLVIAQAVVCVKT